MRLPTWAYCHHTGTCWCKRLGFMNNVLMFLLIVAGAIVGTVALSSGIVVLTFKGLGLWK